ncbi:MAG: DUF4412 domain-containing protein [Balneolaceae bacterium]
MKPFNTLFSVLLLIPVIIFSVPEAEQRQKFEGTIQYEIPELESKIGTKVLNYMLKDHMIRIEYESKRGRSTTILFETLNNTMFLSIGMLGGFVEVPPDDVQKNFFETEYVFDQTGESKIVSGQECKIWNTTVENQFYSYCLAEGLGNFILPINSVTAESVPVWAAVNLPDNHLLLEVTRINQNESAEQVMQAVQIERKNLSRRLFSVFDN